MRFLSGILLLLATTAVCAQQDQTITITSGGGLRKFAVHLPSAGSTAKLPMLLCYHGSGGTSASMKSLTGFNTLADRHGFIIVYPQAIMIGNSVQWNAYIDGKPGHGGLNVDNAPDDVLFTRDLINYMSSHFDVDTNRVYATGFSNGGYMCYALSMLASDVIKGIAPVAGDMWTDDAYLDQLLASGAAKPMPVMHIHGTEDATVPFPDGDNTPTEYGEYPLFVSGRECDAHTYSQVISLMSGVDKLLFCPPPIEVSLIRINGMGHAWTNGVYPTSSEIVTFFGLEKTAGVTDDPAATRSVSIAPNPTSDLLRIDLPMPGRVQVVSSLGALLYSVDHGRGVSEISCADMSNGVYIVRVLADNGSIMTKEIVVRR